MHPVGSSKELVVIGREKQTHKRGVVAKNYEAIPPLVVHLPATAPLLNLSLKGSVLHVTRVAALLVVASDNRIAFTAATVSNSQGYEAVLHEIRMDSTVPIDVIGTAHANEKESPLL
ncbi:hypothetical protein ACH5RR_021211 [Cinchona calisaya]|uniref:Uncharacterized protein n=1 Tax=Cinchona calisaya TaxID=153742 RepID=A0ABD2ZGN6_9GENT